jgi:subtilase family serine protease
VRTRRVLIIIAVLGLIISPVPKPGSVSVAPSTASPFLRIGPQAIPAAAVSPNYGLFTCQVVGLNPGTTCYDPYQIRHAYNVDSLIGAGFDGRGKTIVIVDAFQSPNIVQQLNFFDAFYGLPGLNGLGGAFNAGLGTFTQVAPDGLTPFVTGNENITGWAEEISLDVLWAHAIAPGANIVLVLAKSNDDIDIFSATRYAVDHNLGDVISQSFGENESCMDPVLLADQHQLFADATLKNITLFASSGDTGAAQATCDGKSFVRAVSTPASDPLVTGVGGTELHAARYCLAALGCNPAANPVPGTHLGEIAWNESGGIATGGGFSILFDEPSYQQGTIHGGKQRGVPDVSYNAAVGHGVLTYLNIPGIPAGIYVFGGTSAGSPQWAAILAIAGQKAGYNLGFINKALYHIAQARPRYAESFFDVTSGNNSVVEDLPAPGADVAVQGYSAGSGWDPTTGLGSPIAGQLVDDVIQHVSPGDGVSAVAESKPHTNGKPSAPGRMKPH